MAEKQAEMEVLADDAYPDSDGQPMGETYTHVMATMWLTMALQEFFRLRQPDVLVASNVFWYSRDHGETVRVCPDVMIVPGVPIPPQRSFLGWNYGNARPAAVIELASRATWQHDLEEKYEQYESLGVREYFMFDPDQRFFWPALRGYRLVASAYEAMTPTDGAFESELGFRLRPEGHMLRVIDAATGRPILSPEEMAERARETEREMAERARETARELARLRAEIQRLTPPPTDAP